MQGIGFRPSVYRLAQKNALTGSVRNLGGAVEIILQGLPEQITAFMETFAAIFPSIKYDNQVLERALKYESFQIIKSAQALEQVTLTPDLGLCSDCAKELRTKSNRRFRYPFISCASCGPRYSILEQLPYDREHTSMQEFTMCKDCQEEYEAPCDRRFHAQTISCSQCSPILLFGELSGDAALAAAITHLKNGSVLAVKGIGGYHLACSALDAKATKRLRTLKGRSNKAFAVMFADLSSLEEFCIVSEDEKNLLLSPAKPIVIVRKKTVAGPLFDSLAAASCGAFLPYTGLHWLLTKECGPLVLTSANYAEQPIIADDEVMQSLKCARIDGIIYHERKIIHPNEDSVVKVVAGQTQFVRRGRGYVPAPLALAPQVTHKTIFAAGGDLKSVFGFSQKATVVLSEPFGDLEERAALERYSESYQSLKETLQIAKLDLVVCDQHPGYHSVRYAEQLGLPILRVQHHHAHIASVIAEHQLAGTVLGIAFDGNGYGSDGNLWGGEFFVCTGQDYNRYAHLMYTKLIGGDSSFKDAKKSAYCFLQTAGINDEEDERNKILQAALANNINTVLSSGMGRLFEAVSSLLNICHYNSYEGECAMLLEQEAQKAYEEGQTPVDLKWSLQQTEEGWLLDPRPMLKTLYARRTTKNKGALALGFHYALSEVTVRTALLINSEQRIKQIALSGGVFQNALLTTLVVKQLQEQGFSVYLNNSVPPNDGGLALGQAYLGLINSKVVKTVG